MLSRFKHIFHFLLATMLLMGITSCTSWRDAREIVAEADSLLTHEKIVTRDTAALNFAIETLNGPLGYVFAKQDLAKAYYFMGRNFYYLNDFSTAADYYILCDRLNPKSPLYRGRINSCMGYLCKQDSCFEEALEFYERSSRAFKVAGNDWYYAHNLLNVAERYIYLNEFAKVDSVLREAALYHVDSAYYARLMDMSGFSLFRQQQYDSALTYLLSVKDYPRNIEAKCFSYKLITKCYFDMGKLQLAIPYAEYIVQYSTNPNYRSSAYCILLHSVDGYEDVNVLAKYSNERENNDRLLRHTSESYAQASHKLKVYLDNPHPYRNLYILIGGGGVALLLLLVLAHMLYKRWRKTLKRQDQEKQNRRELFERKLFDHSVHFMCSDIWDDTNHLREKANSYCDNIFYRLEDTFHLREHEIMICLMVLMDFSRDKMAAYLHVLPNTISKSKSKIAKQLGTTSGDLREFLINFMLS